VHTYKLLNLIGHGVAMEGNGEMTGCLQIFCGHCTEFDIDFVQVAFWHYLALWGIEINYISSPTLSLPCFS